MPRYFFHFSSKGEIVPDSVGVDLADLREAHWYAVRLIARTLAGIERLPPGWAVRITDSQDLPLLHVLMGEAAARVRREPARGLRPVEVQYRSG